VDTVATIGDVYGDDPDYQFDQVTPNGLAGSTDGNLYVLDTSGSRVLAYDEDGAHVGTFGRKGSGPGEINMAFGIAAGPGDTLWVMEMMARRLTGFPATGGEPRIISYSGDVTPSPPVAVRADGLLSNGMQIFGPGREPDEERHSIIARFGHDGVLQDTVLSAPMPKMDVVQVEAGNRRMMMMTSPRFAPMLRWAVFPDGSLATAVDDRYAITVLNPDGSERLRIERALPPRPVTDADKDKVRESARSARMTFGGGDPGLNEEIARKQLEAMTFAPTVPRIVGLAVDPHDRLWVGVSLENAGEVDSVDVYERDGTLIGSLHGIGLPATFLAGDRAAYLDRDEDTDVQQITIVRILE